MAKPKEEPELSARERARLAHRDRKRQTRMVVDNAGVKRVRRAIAQRDPAAARKAPARDDDASA